MTQKRYTLDFLYLSAAALKNELGVKKSNGKKNRYTRADTLESELRRYTRIVAIAVISWQVASSSFK